MYNALRAFRLTGPFNEEALCKSVQEILNRHEILRTTFVTVDGKPQQIISAPFTIEVPIIDLQEVTEEEREVEVQRLMKEENRPFDLARGPLIRVKLLRFHEQEHLLIYNVHHIICDAWSIEIFHQELSVLYRFYCDGVSPSLAPLPLQYADFSLWQRDRVEGNVGAQELAYWKQQLANVPSSLPLPTDYPRGLIQSFRGGWLDRLFPSELSAKLRELKKREGCTLFIILLGGLQLLLQRYSGLRDILVGAPIAGRNRLEFEQLIGCFLNNLVLRTDLSGNPTFRQLLRRVREVYNALRTFRLTGPVNEEALCKSVQEILNRHEILRTTFVTVDGKPQQIISAPFTIEVPIIDLQEVTEEEREVEVQRLMKEENRPFDLARGPLIRVKLLRFHEQEHQ